MTTATVRILLPEIVLVIAAVVTSLLVLLCHKSERRQQGHLGRARARWVAIWRRRVAMERGLCRSVLIGSAAGLRFARQVG